MPLHDMFKSLLGELDSGPCATADHRETGTARDEDTASVEQEVAEVLTALLLGAEDELPEAKRSDLLPNAEPIKRQREYRWRRLKSQYLLDGSRSIEARWIPVKLGRVIFPLRAPGLSTSAAMVPSRSSPGIRPACFVPANEMSRSGRPGCRASEPRAPSPWLEGTNGGTAATRSPDSCSESGLDETWYRIPDSNR